MSWMLLWSLLGVAQAQDALTFRSVSSVQVGQGEPSITFDANTSGSLRAELTCAGTTHRLDTSIAPGGSYTLQLPVPPGSHTCRGQVTLVDSNGGEGSMPLVLEVAKLGTLSLSATLPDLDLNGRTLQVHADRPVTRAEAVFYGLQGELERSSADLSNARLPSFSWVSDAEVLKIEVEAQDASGFRSLLTLSPWSYAIEHEDVVFPSGSHDIGADEVHKLEDTWAEIEATLEKYGSIVEIELYVAGYTDTTGDGGSNQALSQRRARAIATWFSRRGFSRPIYFQGFGEDALAVATGDGVDEARNRRAVYVLAAQTPARSHDLPRSSWTRLR